jgi:hypothetical protein
MMGSYILNSVVWKPESNLRNHIIGAEIFLAGPAGMTNSSSWEWLPEHRHLIFRTLPSRA